MQEESPIRIYNQEIWSGYCQEIYERQGHARNWTTRKPKPFKILARIGESANKLDLPPSMRIHNTFHISLLELYNDDKFPSQRAQPPHPIIIEGEPEYEGEQIIDSRLHYGKLQYRAKWTGYPPEHDKVWYPYEHFENAGIAKQQFYQKYPGKPSLDQNRGTRKRGDLGLHNTPTATRTTTTTSTNDDTKTPDTKDCPRRMGNSCRTAHEPPISSPTRVGRSRKERRSSERARCAVMDGMLRRRVPSAIQGQGSLGKVSPRPISVYAISTGIALEQKTTEETPWAERDMVRMLRRQMLRTCAREDQSGILPTGKWRQETPPKMASEKPRAGTTKEIRCRDDTAGEGGERKNSTRCRSPAEANPGTVRRKATNTGNGQKKTRRELANYPNTIGRMREELQGLRRTVAGSGFTIARLRHEMDVKKRANEELEHRNHSLRKELRRAGQRLLDLGV